MDGKEIGKQIIAAAKEYEGANLSINTGGNMGMAFIASAIERHADAIDTIATAIVMRGGDTSIPAIDPDKET